MKCSAVFDICRISQWSSFYVNRYSSLDDMLKTVCAFSFSATLTSLVKHIHNKGTSIAVLRLQDHSKCPSSAV